MKNREPQPFRLRDFWQAMVGSFVIGMTFLFKGSMQVYALNMRQVNILLVLALTFIIVTLEIYALSYKFVLDRAKRPFYQFWAKRFFSIIGATFLVIYGTANLYGLNNYLTQPQILKICVAILLPAASVGSAVEMLKNGKK